MHSLGELVVRTAKPLAPHKTGRLAGSIRAGRGKTKSVVYAGRKSIPYAGVQHYGWPRHHIHPHPFLVQALEARNQDIVKHLLKGLGEICDKLGLDNNIGGGTI
nr:MAG TPA: putative tail component [Caudoviricetes sp.]